MSPPRSYRGRAAIIIFGCLIVLLLEGGNPARGDQIIPPVGLSAGAPYQLVFVTADTIDATCADINVYNDFVTAQAAALSPYVPSGTTWSAVVSTPTIDANLNALTYADIPIYNTHGQLVASGATDFWDGTLQNAIKYDQFAAIPDDSFVWTGSNSNGTAKYHYGSASGPLGSPAPADPSDPHVAFGISTCANYKWINRGAFVDSGETHALYALSSVIAVIKVPEPSILMLLGMAATAFMLYRRQQ